jgi:hypothetical protein
VHQNGSSTYGRSRENSPLRLLHSPENARKIMAMTNTVLLAVCAVLIGFGILIIAVSSGFFISLGAGTMASGGAAAYLILSLIENDVRSQRNVSVGVPSHRWRAGWSEMWHDADRRSLP